MFYCRFVNLSPQIADNFKCSVCLDIFEAPLELPCGHIFCLECIRDCFGSSITCECPECRQRVQSSELKPPNRKLLCLLHSLNIKCEFANEGCSMVVRVENLIAHIRECQFSTLPRPSAPPVETSYGNLESLTDLLGGDSNLVERLERLQRLHNFLAVFSQIIDENEDGQSQVESDVTSQSDNEFLIHTDRSCKDIFWGLIEMIFVVFVTAASVAAIVISSLKLHSCTQVPTLPRALLALGISLLLSIILEITRKCCYEDKFCVGLKCIESVAFGSMIYVAVVVFSNLDYNIKSLNDKSPTCDVLLFEFSFWFVSVLLAAICIIIVLSILKVIYNNLRTTWSEWEHSYVLLFFFYAISFSGIVISVSAMIMGSIDFDYCPAIPSLTTKVVVFGTLNFVCCLIMLLNRKFICLKNVCFWMFVIGVMASFICLAVTVHDNFPWEISFHRAFQVRHHNINCNTTIYIYSFVIVCINYVIIGSAILMYLVYGGICACLFFQ